MVPNQVYTVNDSQLKWSKNQLFANTFFRFGRSGVTRIIKKTLNGRNSHSKWDKLKTSTYLISFARTTTKVSSFLI